MENNIIENQNIIEELKESTGEELTSKIGEDIQPVEEGNNVKESFKDIFTESFDQMKELAGIKHYRDNFQTQLRVLSKAANGGNQLSKDAYEQVLEAYSNKGIPVEELTDAEVDELMKPVPIAIDRLDIKDDKDLSEFKRAYLLLITSTQESIQTFDRAEKEILKNQAKFNQDIDEIISSLDMTDQLTELAKQIEETEDKKEKKRLQDLYSGMYSSIYLNNIVDKINNKGITIIRKECRKNLKKVRAKAERILNNDPMHYYMNPNKMLESMYDLYPDHKNTLDIIGYVIYRQIEKQKQHIEDITSTFINYFLLNLYKLSKPEFKKEDSIFFKELKNQIDIIEAM